MAGRGRRLGDLTPSTIVGVSPIFPEEAFGEIEIFTDKINEINLVANDEKLLIAFEELVKEKCTSKIILKNIFTSLHKTALMNPDFGLKLITGIKNIICFEVEDIKLRNILLDLIQEDFASKETLSKDIFLNAVMFLGYFYNKIDIGGAPIKVLGIALLEYFNLLLQKSPDDLKVLFIQIVLNNRNLLNDNGLSEKYNYFQCSLRNVLINGNLNKESKCWVLRSLEFILGDLKPNNLEAVEDFYLKKLGNDYSDLKPMIDDFLATHKMNNKNNFNNEKKISPNEKKTKSNFVNKLNDKMAKSNYVGRTSDESLKKRKDISEKFSGLKIGKPELDDFKYSKGKIGKQHNKTAKKDNKKWNNESRFQFDHDDRFEKDENFYGIQAPRLPRHGNQKKIFENEEEKSEKEDISKNLNNNVNSGNENSEQ